jgi:hypothetical protein
MGVFERDGETLMFLNKLFDEYRGNPDDDWSDEAYIIADLLNEVLSEESRKYKDAFMLLEKLNAMLDCTNPPTDLAKELGFSPDTHSWVEASIKEVVKGDIIFLFSLGRPYEQPDEESLSMKTEVLQKYLSIAKEEQE